jgi:hypothetical protein
MSIMNMVIVMNNNDLMFCWGELNHRMFCAHDEWHKVQKFNWKIQKRLADEEDGYIYSFEIPYLDPNTKITTFKGYVK